MRFLIAHERNTHAGVATESTGQIFNGPNAEHVLANAKRLPCFAGLRLVALQLDENDRIVRAA